MVETESKPWIPSRRALTASGAGLVLVYAPDPSTAPPSYALGPTTTYVGRSPPDAGLMVTDAAVSRVHARIELAADGFLLTDLNSRNGIVVNGRLVLAATLHTGDLVQIGSVIYKFVQTGIDDYADHGIVLEPAAVKRQLGLVGGASVGRILAELRRVAKTDLSMLLLGETGTGKEVVARALHDASGRTGQFRALNCAAIPENLVESELFGYRKGAFTGAERNHPGLVRSANGGTLLLDEIGDMPLEAQAKLLRLLATGEVVSIGAVTGDRVDLRVVCATHWNLPMLVEQGRFRADLYARINAYTLRLPPLRDRKEDVALLVRHFLDAEGVTDALPTVDYMLGVCHYDWPYNVRELQAAVRRSVAMASRAEGKTMLELEHLPDSIREAMKEYGLPVGRPQPVPGRASLLPDGEVTEVPVSSSRTLVTRTPTAEELRGVLTRHQGNVAAVARELRKDRTQVHRWMKAYGISPDEFR